MCIQVFLVVNYDRIMNNLINTLKPRGNACPYHTGLCIKQQALRKNKNIRGTGCKESLSFTACHSGKL